MSSSSDVQQGPSSVVALRPNPKWIAIDQWDEYRDTIAQLYLKDGMRLHDVMAEMRDKHGFHATPKMYKTRLRRWGFRKYKKSRAGDGDVDGRKLGARSISEVTTSRRTLASKPSMAWLFPPASPDVFHVSEHCIHVTSQYVSSSFTTGLWDADTSSEATIEGKNKMMPWFNALTTCGELLRMGQTEKAFKPLTNAFGLFGTLLKEPDPRLIIMLYLACIYLSDIAPELVVSVFKYAADYTSIQHSSDHALSILTRRVARMGIDEFRQNTRTLAECFFDEIDAHLKPTSYLSIRLILLRSQLYSFLSTKKILAIEATEFQFAQLMQRLQALPVATEVAETTLMMHLMNTYEELNELGKARKLINHALDSDQVHLSNYEFGYINFSLLMVARKEADGQTIRRCADALIDLYYSTMDDEERISSGLPVISLTNAVEALRETGQDEKADQVQQHLDNAMREMQTHIDKVEDT